MTTDIPIEFVNNTGNTDFQVVVFTKNFSTSTPETIYAAWQVISVQTSSSFAYPASTSVVASYDLGGQTNDMGPFLAKLGSTWEIRQESKSGTPTLKEVPEGPNPNNSIVVRNMQPQGWTGRKYNIGLKKDDRLLVVQEGVHVNDQADFMLQPKLFFGVVRNMHVGQTFKSLEITQNLKKFDLSDYPNGLKVTLNEQLSGGAYTFSGESM